MRDAAADETEREEDAVALKVLHTADWHLGKRFTRLPERYRTELTRARLAVVAKILDLAQREAVHAVLAAGDLFDEPAPSEEWWGGLADLLRARDARWHGAPVVLLPGNHDPLDGQSVYAPGHPFRARLPGWVHVVDHDDFELPLGQDAVLYAIPCRRQSGQGDPALRLPERAEGDARIRIGMVHGSLFSMPGLQTNFPIAEDAAVRRGLDYLALGDTHAWELRPPLQAPTVYPSTPEQTNFGERDTGNVALVMFRRHRPPPRIERVRVAAWEWREETVRDLESLRALRDGPDLRRTVLRLTLALRVPAQEYREVEEILTALEGTEAAAGRVGVLEVDRDGLALDVLAVERELDDLPAVLQAAARKLKHEATHGERRAEAERALYYLVTHCRVRTR